MISVLHQPRAGEEGLVEFLAELVVAGHVRQLVFQVAPQCRLPVHLGRKPPVRPFVGRAEETVDVGVARERHLRK